MNFVIGDIHGEIDKLRILVDQIFSMHPRPTFIFIGDYIDKGQDSKAVINFLLKLSAKHSCIFLKGNHEYYWMQEINDDSMAYLTRYGGLNTVSSIGKKNIVATQVEMQTRYSSFFQQLKPYWIFEDYFICHSGISPTDYNCPPETLSESSFYFNRYEFIASERKYLDKYTIIFGHTGFLTPYVDNVKIGIDTAACFLETQPLSAFCIEQKLFLDSNAAVYKLDSIATNSCPLIPRKPPWRQKSPA